MSETQIPVPYKYVAAVDYVGVVTPGSDTATERYRANLGFTNCHDEVNEERGVHEAMAGPADKVEGGTLMQILVPLNGQLTTAKYLDKRGLGIQQYAVYVTGLEAPMAYLKEQGTHVLYPEPKISTAGSRINLTHPKDASGVLLELTEPIK